MEVKSINFVAVVLAVSLALSGCATSYQPAASPRVTLTSEGIYKDGRRVGSLAYGTPDAVKGDARAESEANIGKNLSIAGWVFQVGALGGLTAGAVVAANDKDESKSDLVVGLYLGALAVSLVGDFLWIAGSTHSMNAINIYNDSLGARARLNAKPPLAASASPGSVATHFDHAE